MNMSSLCAQQQDFDVNSLNSVAKFLLESTTETDFTDFKVADFTVFKPRKQRLE